MLQQRTLKSLTRAVGVGLHSGQRVELTLRPAPIDTGIVVRRVDLAHPVDIPVNAQAVCDTRMASTISPGGDPGLLLIAGTAGVFAGDLAGYLLGRARSADPHAVWPFSWYPDGIPAAREYLNRRGLPGVITSKFLGPGRAYVPVVAGATGMPFLSFAVASLTSALLVTAVCIAPRLLLQLAGW